MNLIKLKNNIYYTESDREYDRPVLGYIRGKDFSIMVDAGNSKKHVNLYMELLAKNNLTMPKYCLITHWHWDHTFGLNAIDFKTFSHKETDEKLKEMKEWKWNDESMKKRLEEGVEIEFADIHIRKEYKNLYDIIIKNVDETLEDKKIFNLGDISCEYFHLPSAHSDDSMVVYIPEEKIIFLGDIYNDDFYKNHYRDIEKTKKLYEELNKLDFEIAILGHGEPIVKERLINFLKQFF